MDLISRIGQHFTDSAQTKLDAIEALAAPIAGAVELMVATLVGNGKILACGNGGSAADAQHFAAELVGRFEMERQGLAAVALTTDSSIMTALSNDYGYKAVFERQVRALGQPGDLLLAMEVRHVHELIRRGIPADAIALLGHWSRPHRIHIHDPHLHTDQYFRTCFAIIHSAVANLVEELRLGESPCLSKK